MSLGIEVVRAVNVTRSPLRATFTHEVEDVIRMHLPIMTLKLEQMALKNQIIDANKVISMVLIMTLNQESMRNHFKRLAFSWQMFLQFQKSSVMVMPDMGLTFIQN